MTNSTNLVKKAFSVAVAATTILWSVGLSAFLPTAASAASFGDLIKGTSLSTVYYYGSTGQRYAFPNEKTYFSWYKDFSTVKTISDAELASITLAGNIVYRPGARWIKITSDNKVYVVSTNGKVRWVENEATAKGLGGDNWNAHIDDVPDVFFTDYTVGDSLTSPAAGYEGMLWTDGTSKYLVSGGKYSKVTDAGFAANGYNAGFVLAGTGFTKSGLSAGADITAAMSNLTDAAQKVTTATYAQTQNVTVALSASSPAASTVVAGQAVANVMALDFTNPTSAPVSVKSIKLARTGVSSDTTLSNVYLFNGYVRLSDSATVSSGVLSWNDAAGLFTIPAGGTVTVGVRSDILGSTSGQTIGLKLASAADVGFVGAFAAAGTFPVMSATHTIAAAPSSFATISFLNASLAPGSDGTPAPQNDMKVWEDNVTVGNNSNGVLLEAFRVRNTGSINAADLKNWRLYVAGVQRGAAVASQDANGYVTFDLSAAPVKLTTQTHTFKVLVDVIGGTSRTVTVGLRSAADAVFLDADYQQPILVTKDGSAFASLAASAQTIASGSLLITKRTDSPSGNITAGASNAALARYDFKATGEAMKIESLNFAAVYGTDTATILRNGAIYADGVQIGNTTGLCGSYRTTSGCTSVSGSGNSYTTYSFGSSLVVYPGTPVVLEVRADIYDTVDAGNITSGNIQVQMFGVASGSGGATVLRKSTGDYVVPFSTGAQNTANTLSVKQGVLTVAKNTAYAAQTVVYPKATYKIGAYNITSSATEPINLTALNVKLDSSSNLATSELNNLVVKYGTSAAAMTELPAKTTPSVSSDNSYAIDYTLQPNTTLLVDVYGDLDASLDGNESIISTLTVSGTTKDSGVTPTGAGSAVTGQTITTSASGTLTPSKDGSSPVAFMAAGNQTIVAGKFRFTAVTENFTINEVLLSVPDAAAAGTIDHVELYDGNTLLGTSPFAFNANYDSTSGAGGWTAASPDVEPVTSTPNVDALVSGLSVPVTAGTYKVLTAKLVLTTIGFGAGASHTDTTLTLDGVKYSNSQGAPSYYQIDKAGNEIRVMKSVPVVNIVDLTNSTITNGAATDLYKFTVTASGGDIAMKQFKLTTAWSDNGTADSLSIESFKFLKNGSDLPVGSVQIMDHAGDSVRGASDNKFTGPTGAAETDSTLVVRFVSEDVIAAGETVTYTVRGTPQGFRTHGDSSSDSVSFSLVADTTTTDKFIKTVSGLTLLEDVVAGTTNTTANFIWSDVSGNTSGAAHSDTSGSSSNDWANGYLVLNLDLPGETWFK